MTVEEDLARGKRLCNKCDELVGFRLTNRIKNKARVFENDDRHQWYGKTCYNCHLDVMRVLTLERRAKAALTGIPEPKRIRIPPVKLRPAIMYADMLTEGRE